MGIKEPVRRTLTYEQWHVGAHHQLNFSGETGALGKVDQILQAEGQGDCLIHVDRYPSSVIILLVIVRLFGTFGGFGGLGTKTNRLN